MRTLFNRTSRTLRALLLLPLPLLGGCDIVEVSPILQGTFFLVDVSVTDQKAGCNLNLPAGASLVLRGPDTLGEEWFQLYADIQDPCLETQTTLSGYGTYDVSGRGITYDFNNRDEVALGAVRSREITMQLRNPAGGTVTLEFAR